MTPTSPLPRGLPDAAAAVNRLAFPQPAGPMFDTARQLINPGLIDAGRRRRPGLGALGAAVACPDTDDTGCPVTVYRDGSCDGPLLQIVPCGHAVPPAGAAHVTCTDGSCDPCGGGPCTVERVQDCGGPLVRILSCLGGAVAGSESVSPGGGGGESLSLAQAPSGGVSTGVGLSSGVGSYVAGVPDWQVYVGVGVLAWLLFK